MHDNPDRELAAAFLSFVCACLFSLSVWGIRQSVPNTFLTMDICSDGVYWALELQKRRLHHDWLGIVKKESFMLPAYKVLRHCWPMFWLRHVQSCLRGCYITWGLRGIVFECQSLWLNAHFLLKLLGEASTDFCLEKWIKHYITMGL